MIPESAGLRRIKFIEKRAIGRDWTLTNANWSIGPVRSSLKNSMPMLPQGIKANINIVGKNLNELC